MNLYFDFGALGPPPPTEFFEICGRGQSQKRGGKKKKIGKI